MFFVNILEASVFSNSDNILDSNLIVIIGHILLAGVTVRSSNFIKRVVSITMYYRVTYNTDLTKDTKLIIAANIVKTHGYLPITSDINIDEMFKVS